jgi:phenylalanine-4-hydroxylase
VTDVQFDDHDTETWSILFRQQARVWPLRCRPEYLHAVDLMGLRAETVPTLADLERRLAGSTGWRFVEVTGSLSSAEFFQLVAGRRFPMSTTMRPRDELIHAKVPDYFHDVIGHVPLLSHPMYSDYLQGVSAIGCRHLDEPDVVRRLSRAIAWAIEYGLMGDVDAPLAYGAGLMSSLEELEYVHGDVPARLPFEPAVVLDTPHTPASLQDRYFVVGSFEELAASVGAIGRLVDA